MPRGRMTEQQKATVAELRSEYGGAMRLKDIGVEISREADSTRKWIDTMGLDRIDINGHCVYRTADVALAIERCRILG